jgi:hypothetical protein
MFKDLICQIFSERCQLIFLRLDTPYHDTFITNDIHQCLSLPSDRYSISSLNKAQHCCMTLRYLHICIHYGCFLEHLVEHVPNLERLSVYFRRPWIRNEIYGWISKPIGESNDTWPNKVK